MSDNLQPPPAATWQADLDDLRFHWCPPYRIASDGETWTASPVDHPSVVLTGESAEELRLAIRADYSARPSVHREPRDHAEAGKCWCGDSH